MFIFDDILIFGVGDSEKDVLVDYDQKFKVLLQWCCDKGIKFNKEKLKF